MTPSTTHAALGPDFFDLVQPARFPTHILRHRDRRAAASVGLDGLSDAAWLDHFGRFQPLPGSLEQPLALRYHGHQFRHYNPDLGDGRGFLFAQVFDDEGRLMDLGTKGSGTTPWSRAGDGRLTLKGGVREVLASTMLEALGVDTSRSFSLVETGESLRRHDEPSPTRGAVLVRLSHSHIRIGSFQRFAALQQPENVTRLLEHTIRHYMPALWQDDLATRAHAFVDQVGRNTARLAAQYMAAGFVHGVLNTDNINVTGESFDYGPWRFLPHYDAQFTAAYFDENGLYAYGRQPDAILWNLVRLAECFLPIADQAALQEAIEAWPKHFHAELDAALLARLGRNQASPDQDRALAAAWWRWLAASKAPFEQAFFDIRAGRPCPDLAVQDLLDAYPLAPVTQWFARPAPPTLLIEEVEALWAPIAEQDDWAAFHAKLEAIDAMRQAYSLSPRERAGVRTDAA